MVHGFVDVIYNRQGGKRGEEDWFSVNMFMLVAQRKLGPGTFGVRSMLSLEPATVGRNGYPELLQTGETSNGRTELIDQHIRMICSWNWRLLTVCPSVTTVLRSPISAGLGSRLRAADLYASVLRHG